MKYVVLAFGLMAIVPFGILLRGRDRWVAFLVVVLGLSMFLPLTTVNLVSHENYRGVDRGFEFSSIDLLAWTLWFAVPPPPRGGPFRKVQVLFFFTCAASLFGAAVPLYGAFALWKLVRMFAFVAVLWRICSRPELLLRVLEGIALGLVFQGIYCVKQRYVDGYHQVAGVFSHQNSLGMAVNLVLPLMLARFMYTGSRLSGAAVASGVVCVVFTLSRGSLVMMLVALGTTYLYSMTRKLTARKFAITALGLMAGLLVGAKSFDSIIRRFNRAPKASAEAREKFETVAHLMVEDHPFGIGFNLYSHEIQHTYGPRLGLDETEAGVAHHIYWLTTAECGYWGVFTYVLLLLVVLWSAIRAVVLSRRDYRGQLAMGCLAGLSVMYVHGLLEWIARQTIQSYLFWTVAVVSFALLKSAERTPDPAGELEYLAYGR